MTKSTLQIDNNVWAHNRLLYEGVAFAILKS